MNVWGHSYKGSSVMEERRSFSPAAGVIGGSRPGAQSRSFCCSEAKAYPFHHLGFAQIDRPSLEAPPRVLIAPS